MWLALKPNPIMFSSWGMPTHAPQALFLFVSEKNAKFIRT